MILSLYILAVLPGMLLVYHDFYYDILESKFTYYCICTGIMLILTGGYLFLISHPIKAMREAKGKKLFEIISPTDLAVLLWGVFILLATILSPEKKEAFWGNRGRYTGCFLLMLYIAAYFCITRYYRPREWHLMVFLTAGTLMCLFGITDFFDMDLLHFKAEISEMHRYIFSSTIGNINTYTACVAMVMAFSGVMFACARSMKKIIGYGICTVISFIALILGESDNAYLSLVAFFGLLPFYLFRSRTGVRRYLVLTASFFTVIKGIDVIQHAFEEQVVSIHGLFQILAGNRYLPFIIILLWCMVAGNYLIDYRYQKKDLPVSPWFMKGWFILFGLVTVSVIFVLYDVNVAGNAGRYGKAAEYLLFSDEWGTHRGYIWRIGFEDYQRFPLLQKIFGYGPDTFGIITRSHNLPEMVDRYHEIFDSAHNEYLQYLFTIGPFGLAAYLAIHVTAVIRVIQKKKGCPLAVAAMFAVLCYAFQAMVNINQPIATPVMWTLLAISVM